MGGRVWVCMHACVHGRLCVCVCVCVCVKYVDVHTKQIATTGVDCASRRDMTGLRASPCCQRAVSLRTGQCRPHAVDRSKSLVIRSRRTSVTGGQST